jgi:hypothetical protein
MINSSETLARTVSDPGRPAATSSAAYWNVERIHSADPPCSSDHKLDRHAAYQHPAVGIHHTAERRLNAQHLLMNHTRQAVPANNIQIGRSDVCGKSNSWCLKNSSMLWSSGEYMDTLSEHFSVSGWCECRASKPQQARRVCFPPDGSC